jgi:type 1 glutamine amidotransferase
VVRGGWDGHVPDQATDRILPFLRENGFDLTVSDSLDSYLDADLMAAADLVVQCWTMGEITKEQSAGLAGAVAAGTGLAGWHGGICDSFHADLLYHAVSGGQFINHHRPGFVTYQVDIVPEKADHEIVSGLSSFTITTEQYYLHVDPSNEVLASTRYVDDPQVPGVVGRPVMPVTWTRTYGAGRVFVTTIGHKMEDFDVPEVDQMIARGMLWAAR